MAHPLVVLGAGLAGWTTVREFRKLDSTTPVVLVAADRADFYAKPTLSNAFAQKRQPAQLVTTAAAQMALTQNVTLMPCTRVQSIDPVGRTVSMQNQDGARTLPYARLVLATGAQPIRPLIAGDAADRVQVVNSLDDFAAFHAVLHASGETPAPRAPANTIVLIGAGLIGCEFANDLALAGYTVHVVDPAPRPLASLLPEAASHQLQQALNALGVHWHLGTTVQAVDQADANSLCVRLSNGEQVAALAVLSAVGLRPDVSLAQAAGLQCGRGIAVDAQLQTSATGVYALGDCAQYASAGQRPLPYVMPIMHAAKVLAANLAGNPTALVFPLMPVSIKTPACPIVVALPHPSVAGHWEPDAQVPAGLWRFLDDQGVQRGFVLTGKHTAQRMELAKATVL